MHDRRAVFTCMQIVDDVFAFFLSEWARKKWVGPLSSSTSQAV